MVKQDLVAQAFQPAGSGDCPVASLRRPGNTGQECPVNPQTRMSALRAGSLKIEAFSYVFLGCLPMPVFQTYIKRKSSSAHQGERQDYEPSSDFGAARVVSRARKTKSASPSRPDLNRRKQREQRFSFRPPFPLFAPVEFGVFISLLLEGSAG